MAAPLIFVTGFGSFVGVDANASGEVARALAALPSARLGGARVAGGELPVTFGGVGPELDRLLAELGSDAPTALLALGVHRGAYYRLERRARPDLRSDKADNDGVRGGAVKPLGTSELVTALDLEAAAQVLRGAAAREVRISDDAGGFVCECTYHHVLSRACDRRIPGLFLHVPPIGTVPVAEQVPVVAALVAWLAGLPRSADAAP